MKTEIEIRQHVKYICEYPGCGHYRHDKKQLEEHELIHKVKRETIAGRYVYYVEDNEQAQLITSIFEYHNHLGDIKEPGWYYFKPAEDYCEVAKLTPITNLLDGLEEEKKEIQDNIDKIKALCSQTN